MKYDIGIAKNYSNEEEIKKFITSEIKDYYDNKDFDSNDVYDISKE